MAPCLFILGASGFLGRNLVSKFSSRGLKVVGISRSEGLDTWKAQAITKSSTHRVSVINTVAIADHRKSEENPLAADKANHIFAEDVAKFCKENGLGLIHISTDGLFGDPSRKAPAYYKKTDAVVLKNVYAKTKFAAEEALRNLNWGTVLRLSFVGESMGTARGLIAHLAMGRSFKGFTDVWFNPVHVDQLVRVIDDLIQKPLTKFDLLQVGTSPAITKYDFLKRTLDKAGLGFPVEAMERAKLPGVDAVPLDQSLTTDITFDGVELIELSAQSLLRERT